MPDPADGAAAVRLLGISGSLREASTNTRLLAAAASLRVAEVSLELEPNIGQLPLFNPDLDMNAFPALLEFVDRVRRCEGLVISSPVYAGGYPGALKNALDWLVGTDACVAKPFMMLDTSDRVPAVRATLIRVLETMSGTHVASASTTIPLLGTTLEVAEIATRFAAEISGALERFRQGVHTVARSS